MKQARLLSASICLTAAAAVAIGCESHKTATTATPPAVQPSVVAVTGTTPTTGASAQFKATATFPDGFIADVSSLAAWRTSNAAVLTVSSTGLVTGIATGTAVISATYNQVTGTAPVVISDPACVFTVQPQLFALPSAGGSGTINISTQRADCAWGATASDAFLTITSGAIGTGNGTVTFAVAPNGALKRAGSLTVAGRTIPVSQGQADCVTGISPNPTFNAMARVGRLNVTAPSGCEWVVTNQAPFISIIGGPTGVGPSFVDYLVVANASTSVRQGTLSVERFQHTVTQTIPVGTYLSFVGDIGHDVGQGLTFVGLATDSTFTTTLDNGGNHFALRAVAASGPDEWWWELNLTAPNGQPLAPGTYSNATWWPFQAASSAGMDFRGFYPTRTRVCNTTGSFVIQELVVGAGSTISKLRLTFEQFCENEPNLLRGVLIIGG